MEPDELESFKIATEKLKKEPTLIHREDIAFVKEYVLSLGVRLPADPAGPRMQIDLSDDEEGEAPAAMASGAIPPRPQPEDSPELVVANGSNGLNANATNGANAFDVADSDDEDPERIPEDPEPFPELPACQELEPSDEQLQACEKAKALAAEALEAGDVDGSLAKYTEAVMTGAASALLLAKRGELLLKQRRARAAINDCSAALALNPDCGKAYRIRGVANRKLGRWEDAHRDLTAGQRLDYDESLVDMQKLAAEKAQRLEARRKAKASEGPPRKRVRKP